MDKPSFGIRSTNWMKDQNGRFAKIFHGIILKFQKSSRLTEGRSFRLFTAREKLRIHYLNCMENNPCPK
jgi:hypothetical protein